MTREARRALVLVCGMLLVDTSLYAAITPLLPLYEDRLGLTKASAGVLTGAYAAGTIVASLPLAALTARVGIRWTLTAGLVLLGSASLCFGLADSLWLLDTARFAQGVAGAAVWTAGLAWVTSLSPHERRAEVLGTAFAAAVGGMLLGPVVGAIAYSAGIGPTFAVIAGVALALVGVAVRAPSAVDAEDDAPSGFLAALRVRDIVRAAAIIAVSGLMFGFLTLLLPLKLDDAGSSSALIGVTFAAAAACEGAVSRFVGRYVDRGLLRTFSLAALPLVAAVCVASALAGSLPLLVALGIATGPVIGILYVTSVAWLARGSESSGIDYAYGFGLHGFIWASALVVGAAGGGGLARATSDYAPAGIIAVLALAGAWWIGRRRHAVAPIPSRT